MPTPVGIFIFLDMDKPKALVFDVNETLLDLKPLKQSINEAFEKEIADLWFARLLHYSLVETSAGTYHDFSEIASAVLKMIAREEQKEFSEERITDILAPVNELHPYPDVVPGLQALSRSGIELIAFSNGKPAVLQNQLQNSSLDRYFDHIFSVEEVKKYKPHVEAYEFIVASSGMKASSMMMVAAHGWDIHGAACAGLKTCFINRPGKFLYPLAKKPDLNLPGIAELANRLLEH